MGKGHWSEDYCGTVGDMRTEAWAKDTHSALGAQSPALFLTPNTPRIFGEGRKGGLG